MVDGAWPVIGHLHLLRGPRPLHRVLGDMADRYGPIFTLKMGRAQRAIVVSDWETAKECLTTNDKAFIVNRLQTTAGEILGYDGAMFAFSPYGHFWRQMRKLVTIELLSSHRLRLLKPVRESEIRLATRELYDLWRQARKGGKNDTVSVEMMGWFGDVALNGILRVVFGKRVGYYTSRDEESAKLKKLVRDYFDSVEKFGVGDVFPWLRRFDIGGHEESLKRIAKDLDDVVHEWLREHKESRCDGGGTTEKLDGDDFMGVLLSILDEYGAERHDADAVNKATCVGLVLGASDSSTVVMSWALSLLMNHPEALKKAQIELEDLVGMERQVQESDLPNLHYLQAVVKETFRLYPPVPVNMRGPSGEDCVVAGRHIPKGTQLVLNYFKLQRDPHVWVEPNEFRPERFLTTTHKNVDVKCKICGNVRRRRFYVVSPKIGTSPRRASALSLGFHYQLARLTLATLLQGFDFRTTTFSGAKVDMGEAMGSTYQRASPLEVLLSPRLPSHLYG
ncbi:unnamed protein product [Linum tenue]|uniref:Cytochrome P450 n=1 Tax=Linum tenue TaxID=586396 RepID=A0AAV0RQ13_9ROSI|nr:unnamed protein product [Linum tenue]